MRCNKALIHYEFKLVITLQEKESQKAMSTTNKHFQLKMEMHNFEYFEIIIKKNPLLFKL